MNTSSWRDDEIKAFTKDADEEISKGSFVFLGGYFNEPSWMDWTEETKDLYDHHGVVYHWDASCFCIMPVSLIPIAMHILLL